MPAFALKTINTGTWGAGGNTLTITDEYIHPNSQIEVWVTGTSAQQAGNWSYTITEGQCVLTSSASEASTLPISYYIS